MTRPTLLVLHGPPAVGKHTVGTRLAEILGWPLFHNHLTVDLALTLFPFGSPGFIEMRDTVWMTAFRLSMQQGTSLIFTFSPESSVPEGFLERLVSGVEGAGGEAVFVALTCPEQTLEARVGLESRKAFGKLTDTALYRTLRAEGAFAPPPFPDPLLRVDTARVTPQQAAEQIAAALGAIGQE